MDFVLISKFLGSNVKPETANGGGCSGSSPFNGSISSIFPKKKENENPYSNKEEETEPKSISFSFKRIFRKINTFNKVIHILIYE